MMQPMYDCRLRVVFVRNRMTSTPVAATGTDIITTKGSRSDSYWQASTMYTRTRASRSEITSSRKDFCCSS